MAQVSAFCRELVKVANLMPPPHPSGQRPDQPTTSGLSVIKSKKPSAKGTLSTQPTYSKVHSVPTQSAAKGVQNFSAAPAVRT